MALTQEEYYLAIERTLSEAEASLTAAAYQLIGIEANYTQRYRAEGVVYAQHLGESILSGIKGLREQIKEQRLERTRWAFAPREGFAGCDFSDD